MFKSLNIGLKLIFSVAAVVVIGLVILISLITKQVSQNITKNTEDILASITKEYATQTQGIFGEMIALNKSISGTLTEMFRSTSKEDLDIDNITNIITNTFDNSAYSNFTYFYILLIRQNTLKKRVNFLILKVENLLCFTLMKKRIIKAE